MRPVESAEVKLKEVADTLQAEHESNPNGPAQLSKPSGGRRKSGGKGKGPKRNAARDAWVARQRDKKNPPTWEKIYDSLTKIASRKHWQVPSNSKSLAEAYYRRLKKERP
jgi:hypothetical protein